MTVKSGFFSDGSSYNQADFNAFLLDSIGSGYVLGYENELEVSVNDPANMGVYVQTGRCYVQGYYGWVTTNEALTVPTADATNPRIDRVVARLSVSVNRSVTFAVLAGIPAANPSAPALTRTSETYEISLAQIAVGAGVTSIGAGDITDERGDATVCGVAGVKHSWSYLNNVVIDVSGMSVDAGVSDRDPVYFDGTNWVVSTFGAVGFYDKANAAVITSGYLDGFTGLTPGAIIGYRGVAITATEIIVLESPVDNSGIALYTGNVVGYLMRTGSYSNVSGGVTVIEGGGVEPGLTTKLITNICAANIIIDDIFCYVMPVDDCKISYILAGHYDGNFIKTYDIDDVLIDEVVTGWGQTLTGEISMVGVAKVILHRSDPSSTVSIGSLYYTLNALGA